MRKEHLQYLVCPTCKVDLTLSAVYQERAGQIEAGLLACAACGRTFEVVNAIPRFVPRENYASSFGLEWTTHGKTQYDSYTGTDISESRFFNETRWPRDLSGQVILEVGSGSGRFTEQAVKTGAMVVSFDYSYAVEANFASNGHHANLLLVQADVYQMPFREQVFDKVVCIGVLQHTPDPRRALLTLPSYLKSGGSLVVDIHRKDTGFPGAIKEILKTGRRLQYFTKRVPPERLYRWVKRYINLMWPLSRLISRIPVIGRKINYLLLVADYRGKYPLSEPLLKEWAILDTFNVLSPQHFNPQSVETMRHWFAETGLIQIEVRPGYNGVEGRGVKP